MKCSWNNTVIVLVGLEWDGKSAMGVQRIGRRVLISLIRAISAFLVIAASNSNHAKTVHLYVFYNNYMYFIITPSLISLSHTVTFK